MVVWLWSYQKGATKLEKLLTKNQQHTQRKLLNFENWVNWEVSKIGHHFRKQSDLKIDVIKKCAPKLIFFSEKKLRKIWILFVKENWLWKLNIGTFWHLPLTQFPKFNIFLWVCWLLGKILSNFVPLRLKIPQPVLPH